MHESVFLLGAATLLLGTLVACGDESTSQEPAGGQSPTSTTSTGANGGSTTTSSTSSSTTSGGGAGGDGGTGGAFFCDDNGPGEPNDTPGTAVNLLVLSDDDPTPMPTLSGTIAGGSDVDWYTYLGTDDLLAYTDPEQIFTDGAAYVRMCIYLWCVDENLWQSPGIGGDASVGTHICPPGTDEDEADLSSAQYGNASLGVAKGCCTTAGTTAIHLGEKLTDTYWPLDCDGAVDDGMKVFLRFDAQTGTQPDVCEDYTVAYHF